MGNIIISLIALLGVGCEVSDRELERGFRIAAEEIHGLARDIEAGPTAESIGGRCICLDQTASGSASYPCEPDGSCPIEKSPLGTDRCKRLGFLADLDPTCPPREDRR